MFDKLLMCSFAIKIITSIVRASFSGTNSNFFWQLSIIIEFKSAWKDSLSLLRALSCVSLKSQRQQFCFRVTTKLEYLHILSVGNVSSNLAQLQLIVNTLDEHTRRLKESFQADLNSIISDSCQIKSLFVQLKDTLAIDEIILIAKQLIWSFSNICVN